MLRRINHVTYDLKILRAEDDYPIELIYARQGLPDPSHSIEEPLEPSTKYFGPSEPGLSSMVTPGPPSGDRGVGEAGDKLWSLNLSITGSRPLASELWKQAGAKE